MPLTKAVAEPSAASTGMAKRTMAAATSIRRVRRAARNGDKELDWFIGVILLPSERRFGLALTAAPGHLSHH